MRRTESLTRDKGKPDRIYTEKGDERSENTSPLKQGKEQTWRHMTEKRY